MKRNIFMLFAAIMVLTVSAAQQESVAGLYPLEGSGRIVYNFNEGWRFLLGDANGAEASTFDDSKWEVVCAPHIDRLEPSEGSRDPGRPFFRHPRLRQPVRQRNRKSVHGKAKAQQNAVYQ